MLMKIKELQRQAHINAVSKGFWEDYTKLRDYLISVDKWQEHGEYIKNIHKTALLMLVVGELSEAVEGLRKGDRENLAEEMADSVIRIMDFCGGKDIDLETEVIKKMAINSQRPDKHGKKF
jgi:NTP pyrophosphatase (non-canonical NTP hydrolase)